MLRIFRPKNPTASAGFEPVNLGARGQHANHYTTEAVTHKGRPNASFRPECWLVVRSAKMSEITGAVVIIFIYKMCGINYCNRWKAE